ncbi:tRNA (guanosine(37)-N1)-methyltransferase TrmD [Finegoldia magna]|mgnify:FL=1|uniref:tRNA (guanine-N(1)-)-methyltransferase n=2 Tax=Finegoldia magna TaxID=1260 RepID=A0A233W2W3_FINMA|nr:tRNA (guanosine(37)-N1)-methyltransferase TrmD [Finegoldia magna]EFL53765.1 tRNA (guanine-N(1)-)-methyltransferase [Finegoldia magna BVS033A4]EXF27176.1 tRNA (guanine-N1)-methyltransferase [Finegoldia magna ALB8]MDU1213991.1 tRNA (guanosine(37)-N1)-methyltransferase TrmD [Finegoldia magna]MDU5442824.1 tRNA (guanosine(37)-N1)-methyltransferase TrmD [Finegoldia magna]MDU5526764.1 tRNA (guanosine(37)-N1)-methyltransferase TrmD [Finegoldia magna]
MKFIILTLFPESFDYLKSYGVIGKAIQNNLIELEVVNIRDYTKNKHKKVDDEIYGGGAGMLMTCQPIYDCLEDVNKNQSKVVFMSPQGKVLNQQKCIELSKEKEIVILCGHYEGVDSRIINNYCDEEISIGDYVMTGGELGAMVLIDCVSRMINDVLGNDESYKTDSHYNLLLQEDSYTRPRVFNGYEVPEVLLSGNHEKIEQWREKSRLNNTKLKREDIYQKYLKEKNQGGS